MQRLKILSSIYHNKGINQERARHTSQKARDWLGDAKGDPRITPVLEIVHKQQQQQQQQ